MNRVVLVTMSAAALAALPADQSVAGGSQCSTSFTEPKVKECLEVFGSPRATMVNESAEPLCGDLTHRLTVTRYAGAPESYEATRIESECLGPGQSFESTFPIDPNQTTNDPFCNPYDGGTCPPVRAFRAFCVEGLLDGKAVTRSVCVQN